MILTGNALEIGGWDLIGPLYIGMFLGPLYIGMFLSEEQIFGRKSGKGRRVGWGYS
jgi:hypothetical protein